MFKLVIQDDEGKTTVVPLIRDEITIGRKEGNTIRLTERNVSRRHARIMRSNGEIVLEDLGSYNGIRVNNARITERVSLRLSDQVQIGDYKLYLKSEAAVEAVVDDGKTVPHERFEGKTTEMQAMPDPTAELQPVAAGAGVAASAAAAAAAATAVTAQAMPAVVPPSAATGAGAAGAQLVGNPNRTMVALVDTDPQGRPIASAAAVAAMAAPATFGKLVVISSNFADDQFDLNRPQMIVGRTSDNDIVIAHRSISRNHAKIVRSTESGRYTISDLQSANGIRVSGQSVIKHELRRGDVIDLGHVRLRYVEPGEDFVLGRDAQIVDISEATSKRGLYIAGGLAALVLVGIGIFALSSGGKKPATQPGMSVKALGDGSDAGTPAVVPPNGGSNDAGGPGSTNGGVGSNTASGAPNAGSDASFIAALSKCRDLGTDGKWADASQCARALATGANAAEANAYADKAASEQKSALVYEDAKKALRDRDYGALVDKVSAVPSDSMYATKLQDLADTARQEFIVAKMKDARSLAKAGKCADLAKLAGKADETFASSGDSLRALSCVEQTAANEPPKRQDPKPDVKDVKDKDPKGDPKPDAPPKAACDAAKAEEAGRAAFGAGNYGAALRSLEEAMKCSGSRSLAGMAGVAACRSKNAERARALFRLASADQQNGVTQACMNNNISLE